MLKLCLHWLGCSQRIIAQLCFMKRRNRKRDSPNKHQTSYKYFDVYNTIKICLQCNAYGTRRRWTNFMQSNLIDNETDTALLVHSRFTLSQCSSSFVISVVGLGSSGKCVVVSK